MLLSKTIVLVLVLSLVGTCWGQLDARYKCFFLSLVVSQVLSCEWYGLSLSNPTPYDNFAVRIDLNPDVFDYSELDDEPMSEQLGFIVYDIDYRYYGVQLAYWVESEDREGDSVVWVNVVQSGTTWIDMAAGTCYYESTYAENPSETFLFWEDAAGYSTLASSTVVNWSSYDSISDEGYIQQSSTGWAAQDYTYDEYDNYIWVEYDMRIVSYTGGEAKRSVPRPSQGSVFSNFGMHSWYPGAEIVYSAGDYWDFFLVATSTMTPDSDSDAPFTKVSSLTNSTGWYIWENDTYLGSFAYDGEDCTSESIEPCVPSGTSAVYFTQYTGEMVTELRNLRARKQSSTSVVATFDW